jgi:ubiquinone/menaquinone biosynthesis C-methylase UbiE
MQSKFTEQDTEAFYDGEDAVYRSFWDDQGSLHWGFFDNSTGLDFLKACSRLNDMMVEKAGITSRARVLDLGCGNGTTAMWLGRSYGCNVVGVDLSGTRISNAKQALQAEPAGIRERMEFEKASATDLPFAEGSFTHVWSQATIYHVHEKDKALQETYRVLATGGLLIFDDLIKPRQNISENARTFVYDRLLFNTDFSFESYQEALKDAGFSMLEAIDLSPHLKTSYQCLAEVTRAKGEEAHGKYRKLAHAYDQTVQAVDNGELGWGLYLCQK